jgi:hypothetical protein
MRASFPGCPLKIRAAESLSGGDRDSRRGQACNRSNAGGGSILTAFGQLIFQRNGMVHGHRRPSRRLPFLFASHHSSFQKLPASITAPLESVARRHTRPHTSHFTPLVSSFLLIHSNYSVFLICRSGISRHVWYTVRVLRSIAKANRLGNSTGAARTGRNQGTNESKMLATSIMWNGANEVL